VGNTILVQRYAWMLVLYMVIHERRGDGVRVSILDGNVQGDRLVVDICAIVVGEKHLVGVREQILARCQRDLGDDEGHLLCEVRGEHLAESESRNGTPRGKQRVGRPIHPLQCG
jgi:hypothetical protein